MTAPALRFPRSLSWLLAAYPLLAIVGVLSHRRVFSLLAMLLLATVLMLPMLRSRRPLPWLGWGTLVAASLWLGLRGWATLVLDLVPVLVNLLLAWLFGRTLGTGKRPLISQLIRALEGPARLAQPGIARYARQLTVFWTGLLLLQALLIGALVLCAVPDGLLAQLGHAPTPAIPARWVQGYVHGGAYALLAAVFGLEYLFRRWHLRHVPHQRLRDLMRQTAVRWPQLLRGQDMDAMDTTRFEAPLCIPADHPSLPGHFPGQPLVPGVVVLEQVALALRHWRDERLVRVVEAKFVAPLLPGQAAELVLEQRAGRIAFEVRHSGATLARGMVEGAV